MHRLMCCAVICALFLALGTARAAVIVNEIVYDDGSTDDREFVELYNNGGSAVDISGWIVRNSDTLAPPGDNNADYTIPGAAGSGTTMLAAGDYYVISSFAGVLNVDLVATGTLENDNEGIELLDGGGAVVDTLITEGNKGPVGISASATAEGAFFGNTTTTDPVVTPLNTRLSLGRFVDGKDTNKNGRDYGMRPSTPGTSNNTGFMTQYVPPDPTGQTVGTEVAGFAFNFVNAKYIDPTVADGTNPNAIAPAPSSGNRAIIAWDPSGGGNALTTAQVFSTSQSGFRILAYLETSDLPQQTAGTTPFTGSEVTIYSIGSGDFNGTGLQDLTDLGGNVALSPATLPQSDSFNGTTGLAWVYERTADNGSTPATQTLYLVDANDGGDSDLGGNTPLDWTILQAIDISGLSSGWFDLSLAVGTTGNGVARFNGTSYLFTTSADYHNGAFNVSYRENLQLGTDGTPDAIMRPATFTLVPEPGTLVLVAMGLVALFVKRSR